MTNLIPLTEDAAAVIVPNDIEFQLTTHKDGIVYWNKNSHANQIDFSPRTQWEIVSRASEMTEEWWDSIVERLNFKDEHFNFHVYKCYLNEDAMEKTASESGHSLLASKGIYLKNPLGEKEPTCSGKPYCFRCIDNRCKYLQWKEAQSKVSDPIIIRKIK